MRLEQLCAFDAARDLAQTISSASREVQTYRVDLDRQISAGVDELRILLDQFEQVNRQVVNGTQVGRDVNEELDQRDTLLKQMSEYVSVSVVTMRPLSRI